MGGDSLPTHSFYSSSPNVTIFVGKRSNYLKDKVVRVDDESQGEEVDETGIDKDVAAAEPVLVQVVSSTGSHVTFWDIPVPAEHGGDGPDQGEGPDQENVNCCTLVGQRFRGETLSEIRIWLFCNAGE